MHHNTLAGNRLFVTRSTSADLSERSWLWTGESAYCTCAHHLDVHSRNEEPTHGHCSIRGCRCNYFSPHKVKKPRRKLWEVHCSIIVVLLVESRALV
jgi:hypothetical protein